MGITSVVGIQDMAAEHLGQATLEEVPGKWYYI